MFRFTAVAVFVFVTIGVPRALAANPYDDLLKHPSPNTNALVLIDLKQAYASPLAKKENWVENIRQSGHGGLGFFPADSELLAIAAEVNLTTMVREHQIGFVKLPNLPNFNTLATREGGNTDDIAGHLSVLSPRNVYFTSFSGGIFAAAYPADRQFVSRWLRANKTDKLPPLVPYLQAAADNAKDNTVTIAIDIEDSADPSSLRVGLGVSPVMVKNKGFNLRGLSVFLARAKGVTFSARVSDGVTGSVSVEFTDSIGEYRNLLKDLFLEVVDGYGIAIAGMDRWEAKFTDKTMTLSGSMSVSDLKRVLSLFSFPQPELQASPENEPEGPNAAATRRYLSAVDTILADIRRDRNSNNYDRTATWHDKAAQQLEQLSHRAVDPLAVEAAHRAASDLRRIAGSLRGVPLDVNAAASKAYIYGQSMPGWGWGRWGGGWWGGFRRHALFWPNQVAVSTNLPQVQNEMAKIVADDQKKRISAWVQIDQLLADTRRKLKDKYRADF